MIYDIEKTYLSRFQSNFHKLLNSIKNTKYPLNETNLKKLLLINKSIDEINNLLEELDYDIIKQIPNNQLSPNLKLQIEEYDENQKIIDDILPKLLYYQLNKS